jgi:hypothetical protein
MAADADGNATTWYYNGVIASADADQPATYTDTRSVPLMASSTGWQVALARLSMNGACAKMPLYQVSTIVSRAGTNAPHVLGTGYILPESLQIYCTTIAGTTLTSNETSLVWYPTNTSNNGYSYRDWSDMVSAALQQALSNITAALGVAGYTITAADRLVQCEFDPVTTLFSLKFPDTSTFRNTKTISGTNAYFHIYFNSNLMSRMPFPTTTWSIPFQTATPNYTFANVLPTQYQVSALGGGTLDIRPLPWYNLANTSDVIIYQEVSQVSNWCPYVGLAITSNSLPAVEEQLGLSGLGASNKSSAILFDFQFVGGSDYLSGIILTPTFLRWTALTGSGFHAVNLQFWLQTRTGGYDPLVLAPRSSITFKLAFNLPARSASMAQALRY